MTDLMFLLLLFLLIATTLINPNAVKLTLPRSANKVNDKAYTSVSIEQAENGYRYYVELEELSDLAEVESRLESMRSKMEEEQKAIISLHCDKNVAIDEVVQIMNIASKNKYELILATTPN